MSRRAKLWLLVVSLMLIVLAVTGLVFWQQRDLRQSQATIEVTTDYFQQLEQQRLAAELANRPPEPEIEVDPEVDVASLEMAKKILDSIDDCANALGYYRRTRIYQPHADNTYTCIVNHTDQTILSRDGLAVVWARYQYYRRTGDEDQLSKLKRDLLHLHNNLEHLADGWIMQPNRFNCLFMLPLITAPELTSEEQNLARDICDQAPFEYYPGSSIANDGHQHYQYVITELEETNDEELEVQIDLNLTAQSRNLPSVTYSSQELALSIDNILQQYLDNPNLVLETPADWQTVRGFILRELLAAIDQIAGMQVDAADEPLYQQRLTDYLLLTRETLLWYITTPASQRGNENFIVTVTGLLRENLTFYFNNVTTAFLPAQQQTILSRFDNSGSNSYVTNTLAASFLNGRHVDKNGLLNSLTNNSQHYGITNWSYGFIKYQSDSDFSLQTMTYIDAVAAGLLSQKM